MYDLIITMPDEKKEGIDKLIEFYKQQKGFLYFKIPFLPKRDGQPDRCFIVSNNHMIGSHKIVDIRWLTNEEAKELSHGDFTEGNYIIRNAETFVELKEKQYHLGFRNFRYKEVG